MANKKKSKAQPGRDRQVQLPPELIQPIVDQLRLDFARYDRQTGGQIDDYTTEYPRGFCDLALVSRAFAAAVRRSLYERLKIRGKDPFLVLTGQLRALPTLGSLVRHAHLTSTCLRNGSMDPNNHGDEDDRVRQEVHSISVQALRWFLDAVPNLVTLDLSGFDALAALTAKSLVPTLARLEHLKTIEVGHFQDHAACSAYLVSKPLWLAALLAVPGLKELVLTGVSVSLDDPYIRQIKPSSQSSITSLSVHNIREPLKGPAVRRLIEACPALSELVLAGEDLHLLSAESITPSLESRLVTLVLHEMTFAPRPLPQREALPAVLSRCTRLEVLAISSLTISPALLSNLPPSVRHVRLSSPPIISATDVLGWLKSQSKSGLKELDLVGTLYNSPSDIGGRGFDVPKLPRKVEQALESECRRLRIELLRENSYY